MLEDLEQEVRPQEKQLSEEAQTKGPLVSLKVSHPQRPRMFLRLTLLAGSRLSRRFVCTEQRQFGEERCLLCVCARQQTEDAVAQMDQWTKPVLESVRKEAGDAVLAQMEQR